MTDAISLFIRLLFLYSVITLLARLTLTRVRRKYADYIIWPTMLIPYAIPSPVDEIYKWFVC